MPATPATDRRVPGRCYCERGSATAPGKRAIRVEVRSRAANDYDIQLAVPTGGVALKKGDVVWASIYARAVSTGDESGQGVLGLVVEQKTAPYDKLIQRKASIGKTYALNPGSEFAEGILRAVLVTIEPGRVVGHQFVSG